MAFSVTVDLTEVTMTLAMVYAGLYWAWIATEVTLALVMRTKRSSGEVRDRGSMLLLWVVIFAAVWVGTTPGALKGPAIFGGAPWVRTLSLVVMATGLAIRWTAILTLGRSFSVNVAIREGQTVYREGLFRFVRHPSYSGMMLIFAGVGLHTRSWMGLAVLLIPPGAALLYRIHVEERALRGAFGEEYVEYSRVTKRLVPGLY